MSPSENRREGYTAYVAVERKDGLLQRKDLVRKLVVLAEDGTPHLRLDGQGRCLALAGAVGRAVRCTIYHHRPSPCRRVNAGDELCLTYRRDAGLSR